MPEETQLGDTQTFIETAVATCSRVDMNVMTLEQRGELIHTLLESMSGWVRIRNTAWLKLGMMWRFIIKNKIYKFYGEHINNANDFLRELNLNIKRREIETYAQMAGMFGELMRQNGVVPPIRKLVMIAPFCRQESPDERPEWFHKVMALPTSALEDEIREARGGVPRDTCLHLPQKQEVWTRCGVCGKWLEKIRDAE